MIQSNVTERRIPSVSFNAEGYYLKQEQATLAYQA